MRGTLILRTILVFWQNLAFQQSFVSQKSQRTSAIETAEQIFRTCESCHLFS